MDDQKKRKSKVQYFWHVDKIDQFPSLTISIPVNDAMQKKRIFEIEKSLREIGIEFDTGYGGNRDWEFDWSLSGRHFMYNHQKKRWVSIRNRGR